MKKYRNRIIIGAVIIAVLALAFWWGGNAPGLHGWNPQPEPAATGQAKSPQGTEVPSALTLQATEMPASSPSPSPESDSTVAAAGTPAEDQPGAPEPTQEIKMPDDPATPENRPEGTDGAPLTAEEKTNLAAQMAGGAAPAFTAGDEAYSQSEGMEIDASTGKDQYQTNPVPEGKPVPVEPQDAAISDKALTCTLSVRCDTILQNIAWLDPQKVELVPEDGVIFAEQTVTFYEGESVFNLLVREMKKNKIHLEFVNTPIYNSSYIEGIHNLYEFDCGELSGWMYKVNGWFPNYGCSRYQLKQGDTVEWVYTCDLGVDVGGYYAANGRVVE